MIDRVDKAVHHKTTNNDKLTMQLTHCTSLRVCWCVNRQPVIRSRLARFYSKLHTLAYVGS